MTENEIKLPGALVTRETDEEDDDKGTTKEDETLDETVYPLNSLNEIDDPKYIKKLVKVKAVIASSLISYNVPVKLSCKCQTEHLSSTSSKARQCPRLTDQMLKPWEMVRYVDSNKREILNLQFARRQFLKKCYIEVTETSNTIYRFRVRPAIISLILNDEGKVIDEYSGSEYKQFDIYTLGKHAAMEPGNIYDITGRVIPDPKSQKVTLFATKLAKDCSIAFDLERIKQLKAILDSKATIAEKCGWILDNFAKYSTVKGRSDIAMAALLGFYTPLWIKFLGKLERGWAVIFIVGDSTTGKSETIKALIRLLEGGQIAIAETASVVGLTGTATQTANGWITEWGELVLQDKGLLAIDGCQKMPKSEWAKQAESTRTGVIKMDKAGKGQAHARTRQVLLANPIDFETKNTRPMNTFLHPYLALSSILDIQSIARVDIAVYADIDDVSVETINSRDNGEYDKTLHALKDLRALAWGGQWQAQFDPDYEDIVLKLATDLHKRFNVSSTPLVSPDMKYKLVRLSMALAQLTCSFNDRFDTLIVKKEHVEYIAQFLTEIYERAGLDEGAAKDKKGDVTQSDINEILGRIEEKGLDRQKAIQVLVWLAEREYFTQDQFRERFSLSRDSQSKPLIAVLRDADLVRGGHMRSTGRAVQVAKKLRDLPTVKETPKEMKKTDDTKC